MVEEGEEPEQVNLASTYLVMVEMAVEALRLAEQAELQGPHQLRVRTEQTAATLTAEAVEVVAAPESPEETGRLEETEEYLAVEAEAVASVGTLRTSEDPAEMEREEALW